MNKLSFECDYNNGAHSEVLKRIIETNNDKLPGYGSDCYCESAKSKIKQACKREDIDVFFISGGTQTNMIVISSLLKSCEGVIAADTGHVSVHEAGAIEYHGHKVLTIPHTDGKINSEALCRYAETFYNDENHEHMVYPGMVYISFPTENGTLYSKSELEEISAICKRFNMYLYADGARLGYGLMSKENDVTLSDIAELCDVFYIGGTKVGALCGEAIVIKKSVLPKNFTAVIKQHGALMSKGRLLGVQFDALFTDDLYFKISENAIRSAERLKAVLKETGFEFAWESPTNQQFVIVENKRLDKIREYVNFSFWEKYDDEHTVIRFATSWATTDEEIDALKNILSSD
ncbi:MAG: low specificity L-threonine aldolase [Clostridia bacterium]|nr:low specificity L-threonine aldolase [Clostridia bacterium]